MRLARACRCHRFPWSSFCLLPVSLYLAFAGAWLLHFGAWEADAEMTTFAPTGTARALEMPLRLVEPAPVLRSENSISAGLFAALRRRAPCSKVASGTCKLGDVEYTIAIPAGDEIGCLEKLGYSRRSSSLRKQWPRRKRFPKSGRNCLNIWDCQPDCAGYWPRIFRQLRRQAG